MKKLLIVFSFLLSSCSAGNDIFTEKQNPIRKMTVTTKKETHAASQEIQKPETTEIKQNSTSSEPELTGIIPERIVIPSLKVDASVEGYGLNKQNQMEVPDNGKDTGWYTLGAKPGERGNAVIAGHVDDYKGPAVFFYLKELKAGDNVYIYGNNGEKISFQVEKVEAYEKDEAPIRVIFGPSNEARLNLITCTGLYNRDTNEHEKRLVVYTRRVDE